MAAELLAGDGHAVTIYDRMASPARKFLMAGRGGLNLTHSEPNGVFLSRYSPPIPALLDAIRAFPPDLLIAWANGLGQETFVGSSGRVFPKRLKASPLLRAWLTRLAGLGVVLKANHRWRGWTADGALMLETQDGPVVAAPDATLLALGGGSWPKLGSDGSWTGILAQHQVPVAPLAPSNCGIAIDWSRFMAKHEGLPLKRIALTVGDQTRRGEVVITGTGLEGGAVYALAPHLRAALAHAGPTVAHLDLRPDDSVAELTQRLSTARGKDSLATFLRKRLHLTPPGVALLNEAAGGKLPADPQALATRIKAVPLAIVGLAGTERAISTAGGLPFAALNDDFMIRALPGVFAAGEMLDWDAPTGGYLLQGCFATGVAAAKGIRAYLEHSKPAL